MSKLKMTKSDRERIAEAIAATQGMTEEEKAEEVKTVATEIAEDVDKAKPEAKPKKKAKKDTRPNQPLRQTPGQAMTNPVHKESDPLQGVTIDPDASYPKILQLQVLLGDDDKRTMEEFIEDVRDALVSQANAKLATVLLSKVAVDGKHILYHHYQNEVARLRPEESTDE